MVDNDHSNFLMRFIKAQFADYGILMACLILVLQQLYTLLRAGCLQ